MFQRIKSAIDRYLLDQKLLPNKQIKFEKMILNYDNFNPDGSLHADIILIIGMEKEHGKDLRESFQNMF